MSTVIICGAGVDKSSGINMPLASELVPRIRDFLTTTPKGQQIDKKLRAVIPSLHFSYDKFIKQAVDKLANEFRAQVSNIIDNIDNQIKIGDLSDKDTKLGKLIIALLTKIQKLQDNVKIDAETESLIHEVFGSSYQIDDTDIIDLPKLSFTDLFNNIMRKIFEESLEKPEHPVLRYVRGNLMDFERLLMDNFIGFYTSKESQMKNYMYLSWTLWAFLKHCEQEALSNGNTIPFYSVLPASWNMITLNYTTFAKNKFGDDALYFHGDLSGFIRMKDRQLVSIDNYENLDIPDFIENIVGGNTDFDDKKPSCVVPSIIPPLKLKPVLSNSYIETWFRSKEAISNAKRIIVVGYSFNYADEHFNDLIRCNKDKDIIVIDPGAEAVLSNLENIFSYSMLNYVKGKIQGKDSFSKDKLKVIKSTATEIDWAKL